MPWSHRTRTLSPACLHLALDRAGRPASIADVLAAWRDDPAFCAFFDDLLAAAPFTAFRWETPAVTAADLDRPFECVLLADPDLDRPADPAAFAEHFSADPSATVVAFPNLRGDAGAARRSPCGSGQRGGDWILIPLKNAATVGCYSRSLFS